MNSPLRATPDMKADGAEIAPILLAHGDGVLAATRGGIVTLERQAANGALDDIVAARMKDLADRLAAGIALPKAAGVDAPLEHSDVVIQPVSLAAITGLRDRPIADSDDDGRLPTTPMTVIASPAPSQQADDDAIAPPPAPLAATTVSTNSSETASERNLQSLLDVLDPPAPLRLAGEGPSGHLIPVIPPARPPAGTSDEGTEATNAATEAGNGHLTPWTAPTPATDEPLMLADQSDSDIRLVDLIKRQQSLLNQLNRYPPAPVTSAPPAAEALGDLPPPPAWTVLDQLAPTQPIIPAEQHRSPPADAPPPLPSTGVLRLAGPSLDDGEQRLTERSPMIIQRARAEQAGRHGANNPAASPSPLPAFAAGIAIAFAIAGSLLFVL
jgi:hypothetical protein